jgi:glycosyltransferase involved in cell wall biosynthesis
MILSFFKDCGNINFKIFALQVHTNLTVLKIAVNTRLLLSHKLEGIGWFMYETLRRIVKAHPEHTFYFIFDRKFDPKFIFADNVIPVVAFPPTRHPVLQYTWFEYAIPRELKKIKPDLFLSPDAYNSLRSPFKNLMVIHDLNFEHYPDKMPPLVRKYYRYFTPKFALKATRIATVSNFSKEDIEQQYGIKPEKIDVVYNGVNDKFTPVTEKVKQETRKKYTGGSPYFIYVGALIDRKNLGNLFKAFDLYKSKDKTEDVKLLIVGAKMWHNKDLQNTYEQMRFKNEVIFTGRLKPEELYKATGSALAMTYVSYFEGFGIPILEAFAAGIPVITSNVTSMPEVAGGAALLVDPFDTEDIANAMASITNDEQLRKELIEKGHARRKQFSWDKSAEDLWKSIEKTVS